MIVKFWGAAQTVTGSMHLLQLKNGKQVLLDCGLYQGRESFADDFNRSFPADPKSIDYLILSHAHIDHCGNIPQLVKEGFKGNIYCTHATYDLVAIMLQDSAKIQEMDARSENKYRRRRNLDPVEPLYTLKDVPKALELFITLPYDRWESIDPDINLKFKDAGHMLGSATVNLRIQEGDRRIRFGFTGDVGRYDAMVLRDPQPMEPCDYLISESTYGGKEHGTIENSEMALLEIIKEACVEKEGKLIIPAFSVGRTQNIVHTLDRLESRGLLPKIPVYVDSPLAVNATQVFETHPECYDHELLEYLHDDENPFGFNTLHYIRDTARSKKLNKKKGPFIVISSSGMMTGGRVLHHLANSIEDPKNTILVVGYCAKHTLGGRIIDGAEVVRIYGNKYKVRATVKRLNSYSGHAGQDELLRFLQSGLDADQLKRIWLVHGEESRGEKMKAYLADNGFNRVTIPFRGESFEL